MILTLKVLALKLLIAAVSGWAILELL